MHNFMANVKLSDAELALAVNSGILLTKNIVIEKVYQLFGELAETYKMVVPDFHLPEAVLRNSPKISRGENYNGLPWVMLDYPRYFNGNSIFSIRTMFWWGNHFSLFIILKGQPLAGKNVAAIINGLSDDWFICHAADPWQHHFEADNMVPVKALSETQIVEIINAAGFCKLAKKIPIERWESVNVFMQKHVEIFLAGYVSA